MHNAYAYYSDRGVGRQVSHADRFFRHGTHGRLTGARADARRLHLRRGALRGGAGARRTPATARPAGGGPARRSWACRSCPRHPLRGRGEHPDLSVVGMGRARLVRPLRHDALLSPDGRRVRAAHLRDGARAVRRAERVFRWRARSTSTASRTASPSPASTRRRTKAESRRASRDGRDVSRYSPAALRSAALIRVCQPLPPALKCSITSGSSMRVTRRFFTARQQRAAALADELGEIGQLGDLEDRFRAGEISRCQLRGIVLVDRTDRCRRRPRSGAFGGVCGLFTAVGLLKLIIRSGLPRWREHDRMEPP